MRRRLTVCVYVGVGSCTDLNGPGDALVRTASLARPERDVALRLSWAGTRSAVAFWREVRQSRRPSACPGQSTREDYSGWRLGGPMHRRHDCVVTAVERETRARQRRSGGGSTRPRLTDGRTG